MDKEKIIKAGKIAAETREYAKSIIKKDMPLIEIAEKIESKIVELGGKPTFPVNLSINDIAAHYTPSHNDENVAKDLLKIDLGVHIDGEIADTAFSLDLENNEQNKKLISAAQNAVDKATSIVNKDTRLNEVGKAIQKEIESEGFNPIINLTGHGMESYDLHAGENIPNFDNGKTKKIGTGLFAIEPFSTKGNGKIYDGKPSGIYVLIDTKNIRNPTAREILNFIAEEYQTLPFCSRWLIKKFGTKTLIALSQLEKNGNLHQFPQLIESSHSKVAQAEHTVLIENDGVIVTTK